MILEPSPAPEVAAVKAKEESVLRAPEPIRDGPLKVQWFDTPFNDLKAGRVFGPLNDVEGFHSEFIAIYADNDFAKISSVRGADGGMACVVFFQWSE